jgi:hypothetical protein
MPSNTFDFFKYVIIISIFFGIGSSMMIAAIPNPDYVSIITPSNIDSPESISENFTEDIEAIQNPPIDLPFVDTAFILFYTGNLVIDAFLNSIFAIPSMCTILVTVLTIFIPVDPQLANLLSLFVYTIIAVLYIIGIIGVIMNLRSQGGLTNAV